MLRTLRKNPQRGCLQLNTLVYKIGMSKGKVFCIIIFYFFSLPQAGGGRGKLKLELIEGSIVIYFLNLYDRYDLYWLRNNCKCFNFHKQNEI